MKAVLLGFLWGIPFYFAGLFGCVWLLPLVSGNVHDGSVEAAMTGAFVVGPLLAICGMAAGVAFHRSRSGRGER